MKIEKVINSLWELADDEFALKEYQRSINLYTQVIELTPKLSQVFCKRGIAHYLLGNDPNAIDDLSKAINLDPSNLDAINFMGYLKVLSNDFNGAIEDLTNVIEINANFERAFYWRGVAKAKIKDNQGAINDFTEAIKSNPEDQDAYFSRSMSFGILNLHANACDDLSKLIELNPSNEDAFYWRGKFRLFFLDDYKNAIDDFLILIKLNTTKSKEELFLNIGTAKSLLFDYKSANYYLSKVLEINPNNKNALEQKVYNESKLTEKKHNYLEDDNENKETLLFIGWEVYMELPLKEQDNFENYDTYQSYIDGGLPNIRKLSGQSWEKDECFENPSDFEDFWGVSYEKKCGGVYLRKYKNWSFKDERYFRDLANQFDGDQIRIKEQ